jgi:hypothetical protein
MLTQYHDSECVKAGNETRTIERPYLQTAIELCGTSERRCIDVNAALCRHYLCVASVNVSAEAMSQTQLVGINYKPFSG